MPFCSLWRDRQRKEYIDRVASMSTDSRAFIEECYDDIEECYDDISTELALK